MATERDIFNIEKLEGSSNWQLWHMMIKIFLKGLGHFGYCTGEIKKPTEGNKTKWIKENSKVCNCILMSLGKEPLTLVMSLGDEPTAEEVAKQVLENIQQSGIQVLGFTKSPIVGGKGGNTEYLAYLKKHLIQ